MKKQYKAVKSAYKYTVKELASILNVSTNTVQRWIKNGLPVLSNLHKPFLIDGAVLNEFLIKKRAKRKTKLKENEFYCLKCRQATTSNHDNISETTTGLYYGEMPQKKSIGICRVCGTQVNRFKKLNKTLTKGE